MQRLDQQRQRFRAREMWYAALDVADAIGADARALGQFRLRQPQRPAMAAQRAAQCAQP
jgi:hypothetical protein